MMAAKPNPPGKLTPATAAAKPLERYTPGDVVPLPEVVEKNSDSVWALWSDAVKGLPEKDQETQPATLLMGLPELPKGDSEDERGA